MRHGSLICGKAGAFQPIRSKFRCTRTSTLGQQMLRLFHEYPDTGTQYRLDCLYAKWDRPICSAQSVITIYAQDSPVHRRIYGISLWLIRHCLFVDLIWHKDSLSDIEYLCQDIHGIAAAFAGLRLKFRCTGESWAYLRDRSSTAYSQIPFGNQTRLGDNEYLCQDMRHRLTYSGQSRSFCWHIIEVLAHLWSASQRVGSWDMAQVLWLKCRFCCRGFAGLLLKIIHNWDLQFCPEWASSICMKPTLTTCESLWMWSFQPRNASRATHKPPKRMYLQYVVHFVYFSLLHSHHVFFDCESVDPAHTDLSRHFTYGCRRLIPLRAC